MRVLVAGGSGQLATCLAEDARTHNDFDLILAGREQADFEQVGAASSLVHRLSPDVVVNCAAYTAVDRAEEEPERAFRINADAAGELAAAAADVGAPIVHLSTDYVFDGTGAEAYGEDAEPNPLSVYGKSKLAGEHQVRSANPRHSIVRTAWLYSPFGRNFVTSIVAASNDRDVLRVVDDQRGSPSSAIAVASGLLRLVARWNAAREEGPAGTYHLAGSEAVSWFDFAERIMDRRRALGFRAAAVEPIITADWPTAAVRPANSALDSSKFLREFGFSVGVIDAGLEAVISALPQ